MLARIGLNHEPHSINRQAGAIARDSAGRLVHALMLDIVDGRIHTIRMVNNPDKLAHLGPVSNAWAVRDDPVDGGLWYEAPRFAGL